MVSDLFCLFCHRAAFAVIDVELQRGRGRWPTCGRLDCIHHALREAEGAVVNAAYQSGDQGVIEASESGIATDDQGRHWAVGVDERGTWRSLTAIDEVTE